MIEGIENAYPNYGLPKQKKYPLPDRKHVLSAIRFFNYVSPQDEKQLAEAILEKIKEYGMKDVGVGPDNRFLKYYKKDTDHLEHHGRLGGGERVLRKQNKREVELEMSDFKITRSDELMHYRTKGSKNGVRLYQNPDGSLTPLGERHYRDLYGYGAGVQRDGASDKYKSAPRNPNKYYESVSRAVEDRSYRLGKKHTDKDFNPYYQRHVNQKVNGQPYGKSYKIQLPTDKLKNPENFTRDERWEVAQNIIPQYNTNKENREQWAALREKTRRSKLTDYERAKEDATKWVVDRADDVKKGATDAYNSASKWVVDRADDAKKAAEDAYGKASEAVVDAADKAKGALDQAYQDAAKWLTTAADDVKKTAGEALDAGKEWVEQAGKDVGEFVDSAVSDVMKAVDDAKNGVTDAANAVGKAAQDGWNWVMGLFGGGSKQEKSKSGPSNRRDEAKKK